MKKIRLAVAEISTGISGSIIIAALFGSSVVLHAETNNFPDSDFVFTVTNSFGNVITDAVPVKILPNKVIYKCSSGGGGSVELASLPKDVQEHFGYDKGAADSADKNDRTKRHQQFLLQQQQLQAWSEQAKWGVQSVTAHPFQYHWRAIGGVGNVDIQPLFNWWGYVSRLARPVMSSTNYPMQTNYVVLDNLSTKPLKGWDRITASSYTVYQSFWILDATIQSAPHTNRQAKVYLLNPPNDEKQIFEAAHRESIGIYASSQTLAAVQDANIDRMASVDQRADNVSMYRFHSDSLNKQLAGSAAELSSQRNQLLQAQQSVYTKREDLEARATEIHAYLAGFPNQSSYVVDLFAHDTGKTINGMEVYDLGGISF